MLPVVQEYFNAQEDRDRRFERAHYAAMDANPVPQWSNKFTEEERAAYFAADERRQLALRKVEHEKLERQANAFQALLNSDDKLIAWLMSNEVINDNYRGHRDVVLRNLPMTREAMDEFGGNQGWCGEYGEFLNLAADAGVLPEPTPDLADVTTLVRELRSTYGGTSATARRIVKKHLPAILESAAAKAAEAAQAKVPAAATA